MKWKNIPTDILEYQGFKMKVYILLMCVDYEGDDIIEVFNSYKSVTEYIKLKYPDYSVDVDNKNCYNPKINSCTSLYISEKEVLQ